MAEINDFIDPKAEAQVRTYINSLGDIVLQYEKIFDASVKVNQQTNDSLKTRKTATEEEKKANEAAKEATRIAKEQTSAAASLEKQRQQALNSIARQQQKERELSSAINMQVKSMRDAQIQNSALNKVKRDLDLTTEKGKKTLIDYNRTIDKNTEFIRKNQDAANKQFMNIGNYKSALGGLSSYMTSLLPAFSIAAIVGFGKAAFEAAEKATIANTRLLFALKGNYVQFQALNQLAVEYRTKAGVSGSETKQIEQLAVNAGHSMEWVKKLTVASIELSSVTGMDMQSAFMQLNNTFNGTAGRLKRVDSAFGDLTETQLRNGEAVELALTKYGGFAEKSATETQKLSSEWKALMVTLGGSESGPINSVIKGLKNMVVALKDVYNWTFKFGGDRALMQETEAATNSNVRALEAYEAQAIKTKDKLKPEEWTRAFSMQRGELEIATNKQEYLLKEQEKSLKLAAERAMMGGSKKEAEDAQMNVMLTKKHIELIKSKIGVLEKVNKGYKLNIEEGGDGVGSTGGKGGESAAAKAKREAEKAAEEKLKAEKDYADAVLLLQTSVSKRIADSRMNTLKAALSMGTISEVEYNAKVFELNKQALQENINGIREMLNATADGSAEKVKLLMKLNEAEASLQDMTTDYFIKKQVDEAKFLKQQEEKKLNVLLNAAEKRRAADEANIEEGKQKLLDAEAAKQEALQATAQKVQEIGGEAFNFVSVLQERKMAKLEEGKAQELAMAGDNEQKKAAINEKYAKKANELKRKQAIADKLGSLFQIAMNTAMGVTNAASKVVTMPLVPFIIALGAVQAAAVLARPIPAFKDGVLNAPKGLALVGEAGAELVERKGQMRLVNEPTLVNLEGGETIYKNADTKSILNSAKLSSTKQSTGKLVQTIADGNERVIQAIKTKKELYISADGSDIEEREGNHTTHYFNKKVKWLQN